MGGTSPEEAGRAVTGLHALKARRRVTNTRGRCEPARPYAVTV